MKVKEFVQLVNSSGSLEFSDVPERDIELVKSRVGETWSFDETYSTSMNVYKCEDGYAGVIGVCHIDEKYFDRRHELRSKLPHCVAVEVSLIDVPTFVPNPNGKFLSLSIKLSEPIG